MRLNYNPFKGMEKITNGIYFCHSLPKIGDSGLAIQPERLVSDWHFKFPSNRIPKGDYWFQVIEKTGEWKWLHGIVNEKGQIKQIG